MPRPDDRCPPPVRLVSRDCNCDIWIARPRTRDRLTDDRIRSPVRCGRNDAPGATGTPAYWVPRGLCPA
jgi:hypothetical protein